MEVTASESICQRSIEYISGKELQHYESIRNDKIGILNSPLWTGSQKKNKNRKTKKGLKPATR